MSKKIVLALFAVACLLVPKISLARENVTDWYIKDFDSQIIINKDSSLDITEKITADCGQAVGKHGIFRILPTQVNIEGKKIQLPVELLNITDAKGQKYEYQASKNSADGTVTWKIGAANTTVQGINTYIIHYKVQNAIRFGNQKFDELYWNLNGNFWDLETDKFHASIKFPPEVTKQNATADYYTGALGSKEKNAATYVWSAPSVLEFNSTGTLLARQGITASIIFPKNIFTPHIPSFLELYGQYLFLLIPVFVFLISFLTWLKYGKDPVLNKPIIAEYDVPGNLSPIEMGMLMKSGGFENKLITAEIIWFATRGLIIIKKIKGKTTLFAVNENPERGVEVVLTEIQQTIFDAIFLNNNVVTLSSLKNKFYKNVNNIKKLAKNKLKNNGLILTAGLNIGLFMKIFGVVIFFLPLPIPGFKLSGIILLAFGFLMPKKTLLGAELNWKIEGFKLFMETVDKDRAVFYEKENIFEKCLPYAILFGMTKLWINRMQEIYGQDYHTTHIPAWYVGDASSLNVDNFSSTIDKLSNAIGASIASPSSGRGGSSSGSGGSGSSGGGGGGGGGGGW